MHRLLAITEGSIELLEKAAQEADALEVSNSRLAARVTELENLNAALHKVAAAPTHIPLNHNLLLKVAQVLGEEDLLQDGVTVDKMASELMNDPNCLADIALRVLRPIAPQGQPIKSASAATTTLGGSKVVIFDGREVIDHDGWSKAITPRSPR